MNADVIEYLLCLKCRGSLEALDAGAELRCRSCGTAYPVVRGIPRFAGETYVASFGRQWNRYDVVRDADDEATFPVKTGVDPESLRGRLVLDAGCGGGRYTRLAAKHGARVIGVDLSTAVEKAAASSASFPDVAIVQADLLNLPLAEGMFDFAFSIG